MTALERELTAERDELKRRNDRQAEKVEELNRLALQRFNQIKRMQRENSRLLDDVDTLQRALDRKTDECLRRQAAAKGDSVEIEMRGEVI